MAQIPKIGNLASMLPSGTRVATAGLTCPLGDEKYGEVVFFNEGNEEQRYSSGFLLGQVAAAEDYLTDFLFVQRDITCPYRHQTRRQTV